ncbi:uncharacterized protein LOC110042346 [Orbicella faveolata]|uniref:uncharacterized protein LOC110042346 n=1 Tax=Orbicella faveolata TaxID=48498 RepID=UPI0009E5E7A2|nr:uncharacterized protein LOC110042346 [Orbicella faveolata]
MSPRIAFVISLAVLTGFIAVIRPASSISCYVKDCTYYPDDEPYCRDSGLVDCLEEDDDKCGTLSFTLGSNIEVKVWNCTRSTHDDCNEQVTCDHMRKLAVDIDDTIESCAVTCCEGDECNDPGKKKHTVRKLAGKKKDKVVKNIRQTFHWPQ